MILPMPRFAHVRGESHGDRLVSIVRAYVGCSLSHRRQELAALIGRGVDDESMVSVKTNCGTFALGVIAAAFGSIDAALAGAPVLATPYRIGQAFTWLEAVGMKWRAWRKPVAGQPIPAGALMHYGTQGRNNDHVEFLLSEPDEHAGGGRSDNAITIGHGDPHWNLGRPLIEWMDPEMIPLPVVPDVPDDDVNEPHDTIPPSAPEPA